MKKAEWQRKFYFLVVIRLLIGLGMAYSLYHILYFKAVYPALYFFFGGLAVFLTMVNLSIRVKRKLLYHRKGVAFFENEVGMQAHELNQLFADGEGKELADFAVDLDLLGAGGIFQRLNRSVTPNGEETLLKWMRCEAVDQEQVEARQRLVKKISAQADWMTAFLVEGLSEDLHEAGAISMKMPEKSRKWSSLWQWVTYLLPVLGVLAVGQYYIYDSKMIGWAAVILSWGATSYFGKDLKAHFELISQKVALFYRYGRMMDLVEKLEADGLLKAHKASLKSASEAVGALRSVASLANQRQNALAYIIVNSLFGLDLQWYSRLMKWEQKYGAQFDAQLQLLGELDALVTLGWWQYTHPHYTVPTFGQRVDISALGHPLIPQSKCVTNDWGLSEENRLILITGSNMAGKSTFLRALGVGMVLSQMGAVVYAKRWNMPILQLLSSLRHSDSLQEQTSYFYAELLKLQKVMRLAEQRPSLILLDEILRGTNNDDKFEGSARIIEKLRRHEGLTLLATHDTALCLQYHGLKDIVHYCFESQIKGGELTFDYKIRSGQAKNKNATFLMEQMGIV